jgi:hypothetical protein
MNNLFKDKEYYLKLKLQIVSGSPTIQDLPIDSMTEIKSYLDCKEIISYMISNKQSVKQFNWKNNHPINTNGINISEISHTICEYADNSFKNNCNSYINKCKLKHLFSKYLVEKEIPPLFDIDVLNDILLHSIPNNNLQDTSIDQHFLISMGSNLITIPNDTFIYHQLTSITIPNSITTIGDYAFFNNKLTSVTIPESVTTIRKFAFANNKLTSVILSNLVTNIGIYAFNDNNLTSIIIPDSVTNIGYYAFARNQLTSIIIPHSVTNIGTAAFAHNKLTSISIPIRFKNSVTNIGLNYPPSYFIFT